MKPRDRRRFRLTVKEALDRIEREFDAALGVASTPEALDAVGVRFLGKKGELTSLLRGLGGAPAAERPALGQAINALKERLQERLEGALESAGVLRRLAPIEQEREDVTLPGRVPWTGSLHPDTQTRRELERIFRSMGYSVETGPEVEDDFHNFEALNLPPWHPARDATDTFYLAMR